MSENQVVHKTGEFVRDIQDYGKMSEPYFKKYSPEEMTIEGNKRFSCTLKEPLEYNITFQFTDGEKAVFKDAKSLQEVFDRVNFAHKLEKENVQLREMLRECKKAMAKAQKNYGYDDTIIEILEPVTTKIDEVLNEKS